jgi:PKD repeat protein
MNGTSGTEAVKPNRTRATCIPSTAIKRDFISIGMAPRPDFVANPTSGNVPMSVQFNDKTVGQVNT